MDLKLFQHVDMEYSPSLLVIVYVNHVSNLTHAPSDLIWSLPLGQPQFKFMNTRLFVIPNLVGSVTGIDSLELTPTSSTVYHAWGVRKQYLYHSSGWSPMTPSRYLEVIVHLSHTAVQRVKTL